MLNRLRYVRIRTFIIAYLVILAATLGALSYTLTM